MSIKGVVVKNVFNVVENNGGNNNNNGVFIDDILKEEQERSSSSYRNCPTPSRTATSSAMMTMNKDGENNLISDSCAVVPSNSNNTKKIDNFFHSFHHHHHDDDDDDQDDGILFEKSGRRQHSVAPSDGIYENYNIDYDKDYDMFYDEKPPSLLLNGQSFINNDDDEDEDEMEEGDDQRNEKDNDSFDQRQQKRVAEPFGRIPAPVPLLTTAKTDKNLIINFRNVQQQVENDRDLDQHYDRNRSANNYYYQESCLDDEEDDHNLENDIDGFDIDRSIDDEPILIDKIGNYCIQKHLQRRLPYNQDDEDDEFIIAHDSRGYQPELGIETDGQPYDMMLPTSYLQQQQQQQQFHNHLLLSQQQMMMISANGDLIQPLTYSLHTILEESENESSLSSLNSSNLANSGQFETNSNALVVATSAATKSVPSSSSLNHSPYSMINHPNDDVRFSYSYHHHDGEEEEDGGPYSIIHHIDEQEEKTPIDQSFRNMKHVADKFKISSSPLLSSCAERGSMIPLPTSLTMTRSLNFSMKNSLECDDRTSTFNGNKETLLSNGNKDDDGFIENKHRHHHAEIVDDRHVEEEEDDTAQDDDDEEEEEDDDANDDQEVVIGSKLERYFTSSLLETSKNEESQQGKTTTFTPVATEMTSKSIERYVRKEQPSLFSTLEHRKQMRKQDCSTTAFRPVIDDGDVFRNDFGHHFHHKASCIEKPSSLWSSCCSSCSLWSNRIKSLCHYMETVLFDEKGFHNVSGNIILNDDEDDHNDDQSLLSHRSISLMFDCLNSSFCCDLKRFLVILIAELRSENIEMLKRKTQHCLFKNETSIGTNLNVEENSPIIQKCQHYPNEAFMVEKILRCHLLYKSSDDHHLERSLVCFVIRLLSITQFDHLTFNHRLCKSIIHINNRASKNFLPLKAMLSLLNPQQPESLVQQKNESQNQIKRPQRTKTSIKITVNGQVVNANRQLSKVSMATTSSHCSNSPPSPPSTMGEELKLKPEYRTVLQINNMLNDPVKEQSQQLNNKKILRLSNPLNGNFSAKITSDGKGKVDQEEKISKKLAFDDRKMEQIIETTVNHINSSKNKSFFDSLRVGGGHSNKKQTLLLANSLQEVSSSEKSPKKFSTLTTNLVGSSSKNQSTDSSANNNSSTSKSFRNLGAQTWEMWLRHNPFRSLKKFQNKTSTTTISVDAVPTSLTTITTDSISDHHHNSNSQQQHSLSKKNHHSKSFSEPNLNGKKYRRSAMNEMKTTIVTATDDGKKTSSIGKDQHFSVRSSSIDRTIAKINNHEHQTSSPFNGKSSSFYSKSTPQLIKEKEIDDRFKQKDDIFESPDSQTPMTRSTSAMIRRSIFNNQQKPTQTLFEYQPWLMNGMNGCEAGSLDKRIYRNSFVSFSSTSMSSSKFLPARQTDHPYKNHGSKKPQVTISLSDPKLSSASRLQRSFSGSYASTNSYSKMEPNNFHRSKETGSSLRSIATSSTLTTATISSASSSQLRSNSTQSSNYNRTSSSVDSSPIKSDFSSSTTGNRNNVSATTTITTTTTTPSPARSMFGYVPPVNSPSTNDNQELPSIGKICLSTYYESKINSLTVTIFRCQLKDSSKKHRSDLYVKVYILPNHNQHEKTYKKKTKVRKAIKIDSVATIISNSGNNGGDIPSYEIEYNEIIRFSGKWREFESGQMSVSLWSKDKFGPNNCLGQNMIKLNEQVVTNSIKTRVWHELIQPKIKCDTVTARGTLFLAIKFETSGQQWSPSSDSDPIGARSSNGNELHVLIKEADELNLNQNNINGTSYCKIFLRPERNSKEDQAKTKPVRMGQNPRWEELIVFKNLTKDEMVGKQLHINIVWQDKLGKTMIGQIVLANRTESSQEERTIWMQMLDRPNLWAYGKIPLHSNQK